jgi:transcriptional regulator NrdR family protein
MKNKWRKKREMAIERCDKCGKAFTSHSEVERHKRYEHPVPVSPFEEKGLDTDLSKNNSDNNMNMEDLQKMTSDVATGKSSSNNNDITTIGGGQMRKVPFRTFRA